jgi:hypothetical protein
MKKTVLLIIGVIGAWFAYKFFTQSSLKTSLMGKKVKAKYTGQSEPDNPFNAADMIAPLKNGQQLIGTLKPEGLIITAYGFAPMPKTIPNGRFEVISEYDEVAENAKARAAYFASEAERKRLESLNLFGMSPKTGIYETQGNIIMPEPTVFIPKK